MSDLCLDNQSALFQHSIAYLYYANILFKTLGLRLSIFQVTVAAHRQHSSPENNGRTNVHMMVLHLTISDLIVSYVVIPLEIGWRLSVQWYAGDAACKILVIFDPILS